MEEKNLVTLPAEVVAYLEYMKRKNYTLIGALDLAGHNSEMNKYMDVYLNISANQEKFALAWVNGYKVEEKKFLVKVRNCSNANFLNYNTNEKIFTFNTEEESIYHKTHFTREFLEKNYFGWVFNCEGMLVIEVSEYD